MKTPSNMTEAEVIEIIDRMVRRISPKYRFAYHDYEDMRQEGFIFCLEVLDKYDSKRKLDNFLAVHLRNRFLNMQRNQYRRPDSPCQVCQRTGCHNEQPYQCKPHLNWIKRNLAKRSLLQPLDISNISPQDENNMQLNSNVEESALYADIINKINGRLPIDMRADWLKMRDGVHVNKSRRDSIITTINRLVKM